MNLSVEIVQYGGNKYEIWYNPKDKSGLWSILEIITRNEYQLDKFVNLEHDILDIGANIGVATIILAKQNPNSRIFSFEPDPGLCDIVRKNLQSNNLTNVTLINRAVSDKPGKKVTLTKHVEISGASTIHANERFKELYRHHGNVTSMMVETTSFDAIIHDYNIGTISLLKIDCEGAEYDIIYSSEKFKSGIVNNMVGEFHNMRYLNTVNDGNALVEYCKKYVPGISQISVLVLN